MSIVIYPATHSGIEWAFSDRHPPYYSGRASIAAALDRIAHEQTVRGPLGMLDESSLRSMLTNIDAHARARDGLTAQERYDIALEKRLERAADFASNWEK